MGVVQNIIGMVRDFHDHSENAKIKDVIRNNLNDLPGAVKQVYQINPTKAMALQDELAQQAAATSAAEDAAFKRKQDRFNLGVKMLRGVPQEHLGAAFDRLTPMLTGELGISPEQVAALRDTATANPDYLASLDDEAYKALAKDQYTTSVASAGSHVLRGGKVIDTVPYGYKPVTAGSAQTGYHTAAFDPNTGEFGTPDPTAHEVNPGLPADANMATPDAAPAGFSDPGATGITTDAILPHIKQQESHGDYTAISPQGALGAYQIMPETGRALAAQLGLAWRPDMMHKNDPVSIKYQDALGRAAVQEAVMAGGGDPDKTFAYYHAGPNPDLYGPKTARYVRDMKARIGLGGSGGRSVVSRSGIDIPAAPPKPGKAFRAATPQELADAGYPAGTAGQVDQDGKFVNLHTPAASSAKGQKTPMEILNTYQDAKRSIAELRKNITQTINDPDLGYATGMVGQVMTHVKGSARQRIEARIKQINTQKLMSMVQTLKQSGGNPFSRITNYEAQILPSTLGDFNLEQNKGDFIATGKRALEQLNEMERQIDEGAKSSGLLNSGGKPMPVKGEIRSGYRFKGGDPAEKANWEKVQ